MSQEKKRMKISLIIAILLVAILVAVGSIYSTAKLNPTSEKSETVTNNSNTNVTSKGSESNNSVEANLTQPSGSIGDKSAEDLALTNGVLPNASSSAIPNGQNNSTSTENETATGNVTPPDGRIYTGGEEPYAYLPTYSHKGQPLPIAPLGPID